MNSVQGVKWIHESFTNRHIHLLIPGVERRYGGGFVGKI